MVPQGVRVREDSHDHREPRVEKWQGGAVGHDQSHLLQGVVVLAKDWDWAASTIAALWLVS